MPKKNATPTEEQMINIAKAGLNPHYWVVVKDLKYSMILRNRETNEVKLVGK